MALLCYTVVEYRDYNISVVLVFGKYFVGIFLITGFVSLILYVYFNYVPDKFKIFFPLAYVYTKAYQENETIRRYQRKTKVSYKITAIIITLELLLSISVAVFIPVLFPDLKDMIFTNIENQIQEVQALTPGERARLTNSMDDVAYTVNEFAITFDIKMTLLLMCVGVPLAAIANYYTKTKIGAPLGLMSDYMYSFVQAKDEDKIKVIRRVNNFSVNTDDEIEVLFEYAKSTLLEMADYMERFEQQQKLESELAVAKQASDAKSNFLSNMSHEIRTPINAIIGMNEMIIREAEDEQILEYANNAKSACNSLLSLVNDILDFSKIEAGKMEILPVQYDIGSMINDLVNLVSNKAREKDIELEINVDSSMPSILVGDEVRLKQVVTNLLTNAVKYTEEGKVALSISYMKQDDRTAILHFEVSDTGIGIKKEDLAKLYSPFERIEEIRNRTIEGTGLGMSIVRKLLALMDTKLMVESEYGVGSSFRFSIRQIVVSWDPLGDFKSKYKEYIMSAEKYHQRFQAPDASILVVDDTEMNLTVIKSLLKKTQVQVDTAISGFEMLDMVTEKKYDIIFLDHRMPIMDGVEAFKKMLKLEGNLNLQTPVIALTANAISGARQEYIQMGFTDYLAKPVNANELEKIIEKYLPPEKILTVSIFNGDDTYSPTVDIVIPPDSFLNKVEDIELNEAVINCGGADVLETVIRDFLTSLDSKADAIENYLNEGDIRNYTVLVHALKSSARLIGANGLSKMAEELENYGNEGNISALKSLTPALLEKYRSYKDKLSAAIDEDDDKPEISDEDLERAYKEMKEVLAVYDFDTADSIFEIVSQHKVSSQSKAKYARVKELMAAVDRDALLQLL
ncbi:MAG: response regulator [Pseudobutyrivibrio sp.]|nr:response regulator [Pseudobutyrivibrio sp.]